MSGRVKADLRSHLVPLGHFSPGDVLDSYRPTVPDSDPGVDCSKPSLPQDLAHSVCSLKSLADRLVSTSSVMVRVVSTAGISLVGAGMTSAGRAGGRGRGGDSSTTVRVCLTGDLPHNFTVTNIEGGCRRHSGASGGIKEHRVIDNLKFSQLMIFSAGSEHWAGFLLIFDNKKQFPSCGDTKDTLEKVKLYFLSYIKFDNKEEHLIG